ncbi:hypothetical protein [Nocardia mexicana]|uniref:Uncharacterized protein n=1 Tax=Nocardia mexicana TaxID=279262 RepID=A0A370H829_9NOCA|nr:hypothetical protein [Nocardia mexicana]RDI52828.1 hypothetical protein DFR68_103215 [Nocardia mexicana]
MTFFRSTLLAAGGTALAGLALCSAALAGVSTAGMPVVTDAVVLTSPAGVGAIAGPVASGSAQRPQFDPGPYPSLEDCERARARYYDPSQLECVPV